MRATSPPTHCASSRTCATLARGGPPRRGRLREAASAKAAATSFDQPVELFIKQVVDVNEAKRLASNVDALTLALRGIGNSDTRLR
jgi:hypothetical protein